MSSQHKLTISSSIFEPYHGEKCLLLEALETEDEALIKGVLGESSDHESLIGLLTSLFYTAHYGQSEIFLSLINSVKGEQQRQLIRESLGELIDEAFLQWYKHITDDTLIISTHCHRYLDTVLILLNLSFFYNYRIEGDLACLTYCIVETSKLSHLNIKKAFKILNNDELRRLLDTEVYFELDGSYTLHTLLYLQIFNNLYDCNIEEEEYKELVKTLKTILQFNELVSHLSTTLSLSCMLKMDIQRVMFQSGHYCPNVSFSISQFYRALYTNIEVAKYYENLHFLTKPDIYSLPWTVVETELPPESQALLAEMRQAPTLFRITLVTVSALIGPRRHRKSLVSKLDIPPTLQRALTFQAAR